MKDSIKTGFSFGITSGIITTLGLMVGLYAGTHSKLVIIGGILTIVIADAFSDALGIHMSEEADNKSTTKSIWESTISTFVSKLFIALTFIVPVLFLSLSMMIIVSIIWGLLLLGVFSFYIAKDRKDNPWKVVFEHLAIALLVVIITYLVGTWVSVVFI